jgi:hypothetical protein
MIWHNCNDPVCQEEKRLKGRLIEDLKDDKKFLWRLIEMKDRMIGKIPENESQLKIIYKKEIS